MLNWLRNWKKKRALRRYFRVLPPLLKKSYGRHRRYTKEQVDAAIRRGRLDDGFAHFAYAVYCPRGLSPEDMSHACTDDLRHELAGQFFHGDTQFNATDFEDLTRSGSLGGCFLDGDSDYDGGDMGFGGDDS